MGSDALFLVFDTSAAHCAAAVVRDDAILAEALEPMARGQAEALVPLLQRLMAGAGHDLSELTALGVGIGPGNFTGTRIAVATARGLALSLGRPAIGISTFDLVRDPAGLGAEPAEIVSVPAPRDMAYVCHYRYGTPRAAPRLIDPAHPPDDLRLPANMRVTGHRAAEIARAFEAGHREAALDDLPRRLGKVTEWKWRNRIDTERRPAPLYVRPPDAAPPADPPPLLLP
ncbi:tRNA (adenosine(37)-N6)-threonylcarbamoyltransferase complex dimerization subunit type 1 TsaB [Rhodovulum sp. 12E13]|uniref:tRNA (adenosine(37)-N6)-threonylcarbamoyltransferase complex dimerization subunit type 1 TsaB n=1 Tax=Rhodovulum sp. 12E13 TaxID=2203891 RepID=UPI000E16054E|nr:tRNA (adenosine(37)-N6)-threonylcarbamoyltransferase complex dimerization subunit type 1 TsaB [Rhodovulum sp. 12E13]RDC71517.1 tRNA (adenosine(37)-N6)-threonylcarbamoyltransferase complex dimerization subunit type 1 TsaB [Rhodovulum sp. 12E13]